MIPKLSELTFDQFDRIMIQGKVSDLKEYISVFIDMDMDVLMNAKFSGASLPALQVKLFNVNIEDTIKDKKDTVMFKEKIQTVEGLSHNTFGKDYHFDLYNGLYKREKISFYTLCVYSLAIALSKTMEGKEIEENFQSLSKQKWTEVLPQGFFLAKRFCGGKVNSIRLWVICTLVSKGINLMTKISRKKLAMSERI